MIGCVETIEGCNSEQSGRFGGKPKWNENGSVPCWLLTNPISIPRTTPTGAVSISRWLSDTLIGHLRDMVSAWAPGGGNYRAVFLAKPADDALGPPSMRNPPHRATPGMGGRGLWSITPKSWYRHPLRRRFSAVAGLRRSPAQLSGPGPSRLEAQRAHARAVDRRRLPRCHRHHIAPFR